MKTNHIARLEEIIQTLVEGTFARLFAGRLRPLEVANALAHAMEDHAIPGPGDAPQAPNHYWVALNPDDYDALLAGQPDLTADLARHLFDLAHQMRFSMPDPPEVNLASQSDLPLHQVRVSARWLPADSDTISEEGQGTRQMPLPSDRLVDENPALPTRPFLILEGQRHFAIVSPTISLGRSLDNDIIVDDARVSRQHAQLRLRYGRYVLYDLGSTRGTTVNGYPVQECVLEAGDVISLAGVEIIYGEDTPTPPTPRHGTGGTPALRSLSPSETSQLPAVPPDSSEV
jgi:pSer/pThr/pTyr-binding forkhead associated (FHA) protein